MNSKYIIVFGLILVCCCIVAFVTLYLSEKEHKRQLKEMLEATRTDWAKAFDSADALHGKKEEALDRYIATLQDLLVEKDERIKQLENDIALKDFVMSCAKVNGTLDEKKLQDMIDHIKVGPFVENVVG